MKKRIQVHPWQACIALLAGLAGGCGPMALATSAKVGDGSWRPSAKLTCDTSSELPGDVALLSDAQLHNQYGSAIMAASWAMDVIGTRVAVRPPALNLWSDLILGAFVNDLVSGMTPKGPVGSLDRKPLLVFLGDATDIACTGEFDHFADTMTANLQARGAWLMVHGNHDSYMMGNLDGYTRPYGGIQPPLDSRENVARSDSDYTAKECQTFAFQSNATCEQSYGQRSWAGACGDPTGNSVPMRKSVWLRRYLRVLAAQGVDFSLKDGTSLPAKPGGDLNEALDAALCAPPRVFQGAAQEGSALGRRSFWSTGRMYSRSREPEDDKCDIKTGLDTASSYLVQSLDLNDSVRAILIDTDDRSDPMLGGVFNELKELGGLPGQTARIDHDQLEDIRKHVEKAHALGKGIAFFAHHPLIDLPKEIAAALLMYKPITFVSSHTHTECSVVEHNVNNGKVLELNVASTTDWPMEGMWLSVTKKKLRWKVLGVRSAVEIAQLGNGTCEDPEAKSSARQVCGYQQVSFFPGRTRCSELTGSPRYLAYQEHPTFLYHQMCNLSDELDAIKNVWPGTRFLTPALPKEKQWASAALGMEALVNSLHDQARAPGNVRDFAVCEAVGASRAESATSGLTDEEVERSCEVQPAALFSGADL